MAKSPKAKINHNILVWARKSSGYEVSEIIKKLAITEKKYFDWENGIDCPTFAQLLKLSNIFKRPSTIFFLDKPPVDVEVPRDFRLISNLYSTKLNPQLLIEIRNCYRKREIALELASELGQEFSTFSYDFNSNEVAKEAIRFRSIFGLTNSTQLAFSDSYSFFNFLRSKLESKGILVFQASLGEVSEFRGLTLYFDLVPIIILNTKDSINARIFTLMHEFCHVLLRTSGICNLEESQDETSNQSIEVLCNYFSGCFLVPDELINSEIQSTFPFVSQAKKIAIKLKVSEEVILRKMLDLNLIQRSEYFNRRNEIMRLYKDKKVGDGFVPPYTKSLSNNGLLFTSLVMNSLYSDRINAANATDFLGLKIKHFGKIEEELSKKILRLA